MVKKVCIVGGGVSGLTAARRLAQKSAGDIDVHLFEAHDQFGGRISGRRDEKFGSFFLPLGAEYVHGERSCLQDLVESANLGPLEPAYTADDNIVYNSRYGFYDLATGLESSNGDYYSRVLDECHRILDTCYARTAETHSGCDITVAQLCEDLVSSPAMAEDCKLVLNAWIAQDFGTDIDLLGANETARETEDWDFGDANFRLPHLNSEVIDFLVGELSRASAENKNVHLYLNHPVLAIEEGEESVHVRTEKLEDWYDVVLVTASLQATQRIEFRPELPEDVRRAFGCVQMRPGVKAFVRYNKAARPARSEDPDRSDEEPSTGRKLSLERVHAMLEERPHTEFECADQPFPQIWMRRAGQSDYLITGFAMGLHAENVCKGNPCEELKAQVVRMFGADVFGPALAETFYDWSKDPYVLGAYTSPSIGASWKAGSEPLTPRDDLAQALYAGKMFLAGEHVNPGGTCGSIQAAIESAHTAVDKILAQSS